MSRPTRACAFPVTIEANFTRLSIIHTLTYRLSEPSHRMRLTTSFSDICGSRQESLDSKRTVMPGIWCSRERSTTNASAQLSGASGGCRCTGKWFFSKINHPDQRPVALRDHCHLEPHDLLEATGRWALAVAFLACRPLSTRADCQYQSQPCSVGQRQRIEEYARA